MILIITYLNSLKDDNGVNGGHNMTNSNNNNNNNYNNGNTNGNQANDKYKRAQVRQSQCPSQNQQLPPSVIQQPSILKQEAPQTSRNTIVAKEMQFNSNNINGDFFNEDQNNKLTKNRTADEMRRKSNVVKEIEKIKKNREQRRAKQEEKRQKLSEVDTTVPAWEFANMINEFRAQLDFTRVTNAEPVQDLRICVCVRKRPINKKGFCLFIKRETRILIKFI